MSTENIEKVYPRSPRYHLQLNDKKILRYAPVPRGNRSFFTEILNLSETGMAFTVPYLDTPQKNEIIMVEFTPPNGAAPMACYAQVQRVQNYRIIESDFFEKNCKLVAVKFTNLQEAQSLMIRDGLSKEFKRSHSHFHRQQLKMRFLWMWRFKRSQCLLMGGLAGTTLMAAVAALFFL